jgi:fluoride ion exporter CrcB/FEX
METYTRIRRGKKEVVKKGKKRSFRGNTVGTASGAVLGYYGAGVLGGLATLALLKKGKVKLSAEDQANILSSGKYLGGAAGATLGWKYAPRIPRGKE